MSDIPALLERFRRGPELLAMVLTGVFGDEEDFTTAAGKWSIRQIVAHLADCEVVYAHRMRQVIAEEDPTLVAFDQDAWAKNLGYARRKPKQSLETFRRVRAENYDLLRPLDEGAYQRAGNHPVNGRVTLGEILAGGAEHAEAHARQVQQIRDAYKQAKGKK